MRRPKNLSSLRQAPFLRRRRREESLTNLRGIILIKIKMMKYWILGLCIFGTIVNSIAASNNDSVRITTKYIYAKIALAHPGFDGLSVDSLGKEHFPLVTMSGSTQPA